MIMHTLRDSLFTYEVYRADDMRSMHGLISGFENDRVTELADRLCREDENRRIIRELVELELGRRLSDTSLHECFGILVASGRLILRKRTASFARFPLNLTYEPAVPLASMGNEDVEPTTTWISVELIDGLGQSTHNVQLSLVTSQGREVTGALDRDGRWSTGGLSRGTCEVRLFDHPVLRRRRRQARPVSPQDGDLVWRVDSERRFDLAPARHHRIMIMQPPQPYGLSV